MGRRLNIKEWSNVGLAGGLALLTGFGVASLDNRNKNMDKAKAENIVTEADRLVINAKNSFEIDGREELYVLRVEGALSYLNGSLDSFPLIVDGRETDFRDVSRIEAKREEVETILKQYD